MTRTIKNRPVRARSSLWCGCLLLLLAFAWIVPSLSGAEGTVTEENVKAAVLAKIGDYVKKWPDGSLADPKSPVVIGVIGRNLFESELEQIVRETNENATGRKLIVRQFKDGEAVEKCQMLFMAASEKSRISQILRRMEGKGILTISDLDGFVTRYGGCLGILIENKALKFDVNQTALDREKIIFASGFLDLKRNRLIRDGKVVK